MVGVLCVVEVWGWRHTGTVGSERQNEARQKKMAQNTRVKFTPKTYTHTHRVCVQCEQK
jgi:hypothetical protein